ncbi:MAG TPA: hypothetical protein VFN36_07070 [Solirubrobacteraceae bacterium]|nr:hypothetical protein [Solirubrobacteraceae bacterium]
MSERRDDPPHDVLAAEEFVVPAPDPALRPEELELPTDLVGGEARDILVAEEFAMPAPDEARVRRRPLPPSRRSAVRAALLAVPALLAGLRFRRRRRRGNGAG